MAVAVFAVFASAGLPINTRYAFLAAAMLCVFCGAGVFGGTRFPAVIAAGAHRWWAARWWRAPALVAYAPAQYRAVHGELDALARQQSIQGDLVGLVRGGAISLRCGLVGVPNHRPIPLLALELRASPADVVSAQVRTLARGTYVQPATREVKDDYILDPHDPSELAATAPPGFAPVGANRSWRVYRRCTSPAVSGPRRLRCFALGGARGYARRSADRAPPIEALASGAYHRLRLRIGSARCACRGSPKAASFRT